MKLIFTIFQSTYKAIFLTNSYTEFYAMVTKVENLYRRNTQQEKTKILYSALRTMNLVTKFLFLLYGAAIIMFVLSPAYTYFFRNERTLIFAFYFPFIDPKTDNGYFITFIIQFLFLVYALIGITGYDSGFFMYCYHCVSFAGKQFFRGKAYELKIENF